MKLVKNLDPKKSKEIEVSDEEAEKAIRTIIPVSYTHLTLPTNREV